MRTIAPVTMRRANPAVSVVVPCYNYGRFLEECVTSALSQDGVDVDVTVVDDASTDGSIEVARGLAARDPRVSVVVHEQNQGHIATFNEALSAATSEFLVKLDADDVLPPGALARAVQLLEAFPDTSFVYGYPLAFSGATPVVPSSPVRSWSVWSGEEWIDGLARRGHNVIMQPEVVIRRSALLDVGGHSAAVPEASDLNLWLRLASVGSVGRVNGPVQGLYRQHPDSMQRTIHAGFLSDLRARYRAFELFLDERAAVIADVDALGRAVRRRLARDAVHLALQAYDLGNQAAEPVDEYLAFARDLDPSVQRSPSWLAVRLRQAPGVARLGALLPDAWYRDIRNRVVWRRWRRTGV